MLTKKLAIPFCALAAVVAIAACNTIAPATPEPTPGPSAQSNALNGVYNLRATDCATMNSSTGLTIDGSRFIFPESSCTVANSEQQVDRTSVTLSCEGGLAAGNRLIELQIRDNLLRLTEGQTTLSYYLCERAQASSDTMVGRL